MAENAKIQAEVVLNADPAIQGFKKLEAAGASASKSIEDSSKKAETALSKVGTASEESAKKQQAADARIEASIKKRIALTEAALKGERALDEVRIANRGGDPQKFAPLLDELERARQKNDAFVKSLASGNAMLGQTAQSAKSTVAALRNVPSQFTDIIVSLQGGQAPLTVLLQQGGQLKDMFGGVGNAARALGGYVLGLVNPFTVAAAAVGGIVLAYEAGAREQREFQKSLILTGNAAGVTADQLSDISARIDRFSGATQGKAAEALNVFVNAGIKGRENLERFTSTAIEFERAGGGAIEKVAENFAKLGKDPLKASLALNESMNFLTVSLYEQIKALEDQGRATEAARVAQDAYDAALKDSTPQLVQNLGYIERGWIAIKDAIGEAIDEAKKIGRPQTASNRLDEARRSLAFDQKAGPSIYGSDRIGDFNRRIDEQKSLIYGLEEMARLESKSLTIKQQQAESLKVAIQADEIRAKYLGQQVEKAKELASITNSFNSGGLSAAERDRAIAEVEKRFQAKEEKPKDPTQSPAYKEALRVAELRQELRIKENKEIDKWYQEQEDIQRKRFAKIDEQALKQAAEMFASADKIRAQADAQENANEAYGKGKSALQELTLAQLEKTRADLQSTDRVIPGVIDAIDQQIEAQKRLIVATKTGENLDFGAKQAEDASKAFKKMQEDAARAAEDINKSLTDALLRGFESGKGFAENFRDSLKNMFKTLVLRPVISAIVNPVSQGISGFLGSAGGAGGKASGFLGSFGNFSSLIGGGIGSLTAGFQGASLAAGLAGPTTIGAGGLTGIGAALGAGPFAGAISALSSAMPYLGAAIVLYETFKHKKTPHVGSAVNTTLMGTAMTDTSDYLAGNFNAETDRALRFMTLGSVGTLNKLDQLFGGAGGFTANAKFASDNKDPSAADATIFRGGQEVAALSGEGYKLYAKASDEAFKAFSKDFDGLTLSAIKSLEKVPAYVKAEFDKLGEVATTEGLAALVDQIGVFQFQLENMKLAIGSLGSASDEALASIIANAGGIQQFSAAVDVYYTNFFTQAERTAFETERLSEQFARLGLDMPKTREAFRDLVESTNTTTEEGQKLYASLISISGAFAAVIPEAEEASKAIGDIAKGAVEAAKQVIESSYAPLTSSYGTTVQNGVSFTTGNISDIARAASGASGALGDVTDALTDASRAWSTVADSIDAEIRRIRGEIAGRGPEGAAKALTNFTTLTAQARAGDVKAAGMLPKASQDYLALVSGSASTAEELRRAQSTTLASLIETQKTIGLAPTIGFTPPSVASIPGAVAAKSGSLDSLIEEVKALKFSMETGLAASNINTRKTADTLVRVTDGGDAMRSRTVT